MKTISREILDQWKTTQNKFQLIDVRTPEEHYTHNIGGKLIPLDELIRRCSEIKKDIPVVFYCRKGIRSQIAIQRLLEIFPEADFYNLEGGIG
jgi:rhodanese-related sulfurtransferase